MDRNIIYNRYQNYRTVYSLICVSWVWAPAPSLFGEKFSRIDSLPLMSIRVCAQSAIKSGSAESEARTEEVIIEPDNNGVFTHPLLGSITIGAIKEVNGGVTVNFIFNGLCSTDAWLNGDQASSFLFKALDQIVEAGGRVPPEFPERVTLTDVFLRQGGPSLELNVMKKPDSSGGCWEELSKIQISFAQ